MRLVLLGPPGAGKGTQAAILSEKFGVPHISTGDLFRANIGQATAFGVEAKKYIDAELVPSSITNDMVKARVAEPDAATVSSLTDFPRSVEQAQALEGILKDPDTKLDGVLSFVVDEDIVVERMLAAAVQTTPRTSSATDSGSTATRRHRCSTITRTASSPSTRSARSKRSTLAHWQRWVSNGLRA